MSDKISILVIKQWIGCSTVYLPQYAPISINGSEGSEYEELGPPKMKVHLCIRNDTVIVNS